MITRFIDLDTGEVRARMTGSAIVNETSKRGATVKYAVQFVRDAVVVELDAANGEHVYFGLKAPASYDSVAYVIGQLTAAKTGTSTATVYTFTIQFLSALLDQQFAGNLDEVDLVPEIKWTSTAENGETLAYDWTVQNNVQRGGESVPSYPVTATLVQLAQVSRLTGGVLSTDLDAQALAGYPNGSIFTVVTDLGNGTLGESRWQKRTGTESITDLVAGVILCLDGTHLYRVAG